MIMLYVITVFILLMIVIPIFCFARSKQLRSRIFFFFVLLGTYGKTVTLGAFILGFSWALLAAVFGRLIEPEPALDNFFVNMTVHFSVPSGFYSL